MPLLTLLAFLACGSDPTTEPPPGSTTDTAEPTVPPPTETDGTDPTDPPTETGTTDTDTEPVDPYAFSYPLDADFSAMTWTEAFEALTAEVALDYPTATHKGLDLVALHDAILPEISQAEIDDDRPAFYEALRRYVWAFPDGKVELQGDDGGFVGDHIGGSYGLALDVLDDGTAIVSAVNPGGSADDAGLNAGTVVTAWNEVPILDAIDAVDVIFGERPPATERARKHLQARLLVRDPIDSEATVSFLNPIGLTQTAELHAEFDNYAGLDLTSPVEAFDPVDIAFVAASPGGFGIFRVHYVTPQVVPIAQQAFVDFTNFGAPGVLVDLRGCDGVDQVAGGMMVAGAVTVPTFYMYQAWQNLTTGQLERDLDNPGDLLEVEPPPFSYEGPIVALINEGTAGACEAMAATIGDLPRGAIVGFDPTHGSPGLDTVRIQLPEGLAMVLPVGAPLGLDEEIEWTSRADGTGGVAPTVVVERTLENILDLRSGLDVELGIAEALLETL